MKIKYLAFLLLGCGNTSKNPTVQNFNGTIIYKVTIDHKGYIPNLDIYRKEMGDSLKICFLDDKYYMTFNGTNKVETWYDNKTGKQYSILNNKDTLYVDNAEKAVRKLEDSDKMNETENILGRKCNSFYIKTDGNETTFFYDPKLHISSERYDRHEFGFVNLYYQKCKAPFLKSIRTSGDFIYTYTAVNIDTTRPVNNLFAIPFGLPEASLMR